MDRFHRRGPARAAVGAERRAWKDAGRRPEVRENEEGLECRGVQRGSEAGDERLHPRPPAASLTDPSFQIVLFAYSKGRCSAFCLSSAALKRNLKALSTPNVCVCEISEPRGEAPSPSAVSARYAVSVPSRARLRRRCGAIVAALGPESGSAGSR